MSNRKSQLNFSDHFYPHYADLRCVICDSRSAPFYDDRFGKKGLDFLCQTCFNEVQEVKAIWAMEDDLND